MYKPYHGDSSFISMAIQWYYGDVFICNVQIAGDQCKYECREIIRQRDLEQVALENKETIDINVVEGIMKYGYNVYFRY